MGGEATATPNGLAGNRCYLVSLPQEVVIPAGHQMVVPGNIPAGFFRMELDGGIKPPGGKCVIVGRSLLERGREVHVEMFNPLDEDVLQWKNTHVALVHPVEVEENPDSQSQQKDESFMLSQEDDCLGTVAGSS